MRRSRDGRAEFASGFRMSRKYKSRYFMRSTVLQELPADKRHYTVTLSG